MPQVSGNEIGGSLTLTFDRAGKRGMRLVTVGAGAPTCYTLLSGTVRADWLTGR
jgi:hypothetical protein